MAVVYKHEKRGWVLAKTDDDVIKSACERHNVPYKQIKKVPTLKTLERWLADGICPTPDGCRVEPDGSCEHGFPSWLLILGFI